MGKEWRGLGSKKERTASYSGRSRLKAKEGPGLILLAQPVFLLSVISSFFTQNKGAGPGHRAPPLDPPESEKEHLAKMSSD